MIFVLITPCTGNSADIIDTMNSIRAVRIKTNGIIRKYTSPNGKWNG